uniref:Reverse transcriptase N-terminal domain-containing protein n=1 Tax=Chondria sp. (in: red algae) TaxID=1982705 RepID=A0A1Z1MDU7_9FLOR|nr:hypothetical protein [Chondria sp. (in: red algae)]
MYTLTDQNVLYYQQHCRKFPWHIIYLRISRIQNEIYKASKKHKLIYVSHLQKYLFNSSEAKLFAIKNTFMQFYISNKRLKNSDFLSSKLSYSYIFQILLDKDIPNDIVISTTKQNLIYLLIEPYQKAKIKQLTYQQIFKDNHYIDWLIKHHSYSSNYFKINHKNLINIISSKFNSSKYISESIKNWLYSGYLENVYMFTNLVNKYSMNPIYFFRNAQIPMSDLTFVGLIEHVLFFDIIWLIFILIVNIDNISTYIQSSFVKSLPEVKYSKLKQIVKTFFYQMQLGRDLKEILLEYNFSAIYKISQTYNNYRKIFIYFRDIRYYNKYINIVLYMSDIKKSIRSASIFTKRYKLNSSINAYIYYNNIHSYYSN